MSQADYYLGKKMKGNDVSPDILEKKYMSMSPTFFLNKGYR
jgi:hypothetical protein